jgi:hypothetical protein
VIERLRVLTQWLVAPSPVVCAAKAQPRSLSIGRASAPTFILRIGQTQQTAEDSYDVALETVARGMTGANRLVQTMFGYWQQEVNLQ